MLVYIDDRDDEEFNDDYGYDYGYEEDSESDDSQKHLYDYIENDDSYVDEVYYIQCEK